MPGRGAETEGPAQAAVGRARRRAPRPASPGSGSDSSVAITTRLGRIGLHAAAKNRRRRVEDGVGERRDAVEEDLQQKDPGQQRCRRCGARPGRRPRPASACRAAKISGAASTATAVSAARAANATVTTTLVDSLVVRSSERGEHRDERRRQHAAEQQLVDDVRRLVADRVGVGERGLTDDGAEDRDADQAGDPRQGRACRDTRFERSSERTGQPAVPPALSQPRAARSVSSIAMRRASSSLTSPSTSSTETFAVAPTDADFDGPGHEFVEARIEQPQAVATAVGELRVRRWADAAGPPGPWPCRPGRRRCPVSDRLAKLGQFLLGRLRCRSADGAARSRGPGGRCATTRRCRRRAGRTSRRRRSRNGRPRPRRTTRSNRRLASGPAWRSSATARSARWLRALGGRRRAPTPAPVRPTPAHRLRPRRRAAAPVDHADGGAGTGEHDAERRHDRLGHLRREEPVAERRAIDGSEVGDHGGEDLIDGRRVAGVVRRRAAWPGRSPAA